MQSHVSLVFLSATSDTTFFRFVKEQTAFELFGQKPKISTAPALIFSSWWRMTGSNRRPPACKAGALPAELIPRVDGGSGWSRTNDPRLIKTVL